MLLTDAVVDQLKFGVLHAHNSTVGTAEATDRQRSARLNECSNGLLDVAMICEYFDCAERLNARVRRTLDNGHLCAVQ
jgi:hypothetical protein